MISFPAKFFTQIAARRKEFDRLTLPIIRETLGQLDFALAMEAAQAGAISRLLGQEAAALECFRQAVRLYWPFDQAARAGLLEDHALAGQLFCEGAICAQSGGQAERAAQLFEWSLQRFDQVSHADLAAWQPGGAHEHHQYGQIMLFRAYAGLRTGRWESVAGAAAEAARSLERSEAVLHELAALPRVLSLAAAWREQPTSANADAAREALVQVVTGGETYLAQAMACRFVWDLKTALPELFGSVQAKGK